MTKIPESPDDKVGQIIALDKEADSGQSSGNKKVDPFDPANLRIGQNFGAQVGVRKHLTTVPVRKPHRQAWIRVRPEPEHRLETMAFEWHEDRELYLVSPELWGSVPELFNVCLFTTITRQGVLSLWPAKMPAPDGRTNNWHLSALHGAELAMTRWVRVAANMDLGAYEVFEAAMDFPDPEWPEKPLKELLKIGFGGKFIDSEEHPVLQSLRGAQ